MRKTWLIASLAAASILILGCPPKNEGGGGTATGGGGGGTGDILVGEFGSLSGNQATFGQATHQGIILGMDEVNSAGGAFGSIVVASVS